MLASLESHDTIKVKNLFVEALSSIRGVAEMALGRRVGIRVNIKPQHFNDTSTGYLITATMEVDPLLNLPYQIHPFAKVASLTYGPNSCVDLDFGHWSDYDDEDKQIAMVIDYDTRSYRYHQPTLCSRCLKDRRKDRCHYRSMTEVTTQQ